MRSSSVRCAWWCCILSLAVAAGCNSTHTANERFTLAWKNTNQTVGVRYSTDGTAWTTATFPPITTTLGPGAAADANGLSYLVAAPGTGNGAMHLVWGLGTDTYSQFPDTVALPGGGADSAPSIAHAGGAKWLFAFRRQSSARVMAYDSGTKAFTDVTPAIGVNNTFVAGRPSVAVKGTRVVVTWFRNQPGAPELQVVVGDADAQGNVTFQPGFPLPNTENGFGPVREQHDLTHDTDAFLLGVLRADNNPPGPLQTFTMFFYESSNGTTWTRRTQLGVGNPPGISLRAVPMSIAAHSDGTILVAQNPPPSPQVFRFDGAVWSMLNAAAFAGNPEANRDIALIASGRP